MTDETAHDIAENLARIAENLVQVSYRNAVVLARCAAIIAEAILILGRVQVERDYSISSAEEVNALRDDHQVRDADVLLLFQMALQGDGDFNRDLWDR